MTRDASKVAPPPNNEEREQDIRAIAIEAASRMFEGRGANEGSVIVAADKIAYYILTGKRR